MPTRNAGSASSRAGLVPRRPRPAPARSRAGSASGAPGQQGGAADQAQVTVGLGMVAQAALGLRVELLGQESRRAGAVEHLLEQLLGVGPAAGAQVGLDHPRRADVEAALAPGQAVVPPVAV